MAIRFKKAAVLTIFAIIAALILSLVTGGGVHFTNAAPRSAENFEKTNVLEDLTGAKFDGKEFSLDDYGFDENKSTQVFAFVEYCYSFYANNQSNFGLYVYVYNPQGLNLRDNSTENKIQISFGAQNDDYAKYPLLFLNKSATPGTEGLFYKYKILLTADQRAQAIGKLDVAARVYKVSGIELLTDGERLAHEYTVARTYTYTGYAEGYGEKDVESAPLGCTSNEMETVELEVHDTFYRTQTSDKGKYYQNQINTVYFAVPNRLFREYGRLQRIKAEWYEYTTKYIAVTSNKDFYDRVLPFMGEIIEGEQGSGYYRDDIYYGLASDVKASNLGLASDGFIWNYYTDSRMPPDYQHYMVRLPTVEQITELNYLFYTAADIQAYDPFKSVKDSGGVDSAAIKDYIYNYGNFRTGSLPIKDGAISADLFEEDIPEERKIDNAQGKVQKGYSYYDFDADLDIMSWLSYSDTAPGFWTNAQRYGFWNALFKQYPSEYEETGKTIEPIKVLSDSDVAGSEKDISESLLVHYDDVNPLKEFYESSKSADKSVVLFRFAVTDYKSGEVDITWDKQANITGDKSIEGQAYVAKGEVFLDFDIIQLTFFKDGMTTVIPVASSPIDIVPDITPPTAMTDEKFNWLIWSIIMGSMLVAFVSTALIEKKFRRGT